LARFVTLGTDCLVILNHFDDAIDFQEANRGGRSTLVKLGMAPDVGALGLGKRVQWAVLQRIFIPWRSTGAWGAAMHPTAPFSAHCR
jgi:hypothetical protein